MTSWCALALKLQSRDIPAMMRAEGGNVLDVNHMHWAYNALDSTITLRVHNALALNLRSRNEPHARTSYQFVRAMQGPALDMMMRGVAIQPLVRQDETHRYTAIRDKAQALLNHLADALWGPEAYEEITRTKELYTPIGKRGQPLAPRTRTVSTRRDCVRPRGLNPNSPAQVLAFFNVALGLPVEYEIRKTPAGSIRTPSANDKALRKWAQRRMKGPGVNVRDPTVQPVNLAAPFVSLILTIRDAVKSLSVLNTALGPGGRMYCSYNVVGTENGRWSSSSSAFGTGTNLQNISPTMRRMFCADDGQRLISTDLEQAESYVVAGTVWEHTGDDTYWRAILSGDLHTTVCRMAWPELDWNDTLLHNRALADAPYPDLRSYSYRDVAKRVGHGSNYGGSPYGIAEAVGIPSHIVEEFQRRYFAAFPAIPEWHNIIRALLQSDRYLDTPLARRRHFLGRPNEGGTQREALAFIPQSTVGELLNLIMLKCWYRSKLSPTHPSHLPIQLLLQNHDAFLFQTPMTVDLPTTIRAVNHEFRTTPITFTRAGETRSMTIPGEFVTGWNWGYKDKGSDQASWKYKDGNPDGLTKWGGSDSRARQQRATVSLGEWVNHL